MIIGHCGQCDEHAQLHTTAEIYSHIRLRTSRNTIDAMSQALQAEAADDEEGDLSGDPVPA